MATRNLIVSMIQKAGEKGKAMTSALNSAFDNANEYVAKKMPKKEVKK